ncbi:MAG TPA: hypothetical protein VJ548_05730 [Azospira sp.]|nr:hypothetical protein [Azospira sp.]
MKSLDLVGIIKQVATEQGYEVQGTEIYLDKYNAVAYSIQENNSGYIQVHQWEYTNEEGIGRYGRAVYSIRSISDAIQFCSVLIASATLRARR